MKKENRMDCVYGWDWKKGWYLFRLIVPVIKESVAFLHESWIIAMERFLKSWERNKLSWVSHLQKGFPDFFFFSLLYPHWRSAIVAAQYSGTDEGFILLWLTSALHLTAKCMSKTLRYLPKLDLRKVITLQSSDYFVRLASSLMLSQRTRVKAMK